MMPTQTMPTLPQVFPTAITKKMNVNNSVGFTAPYPTIEITNFGSMAFTDGIQFKFTFNLQNTQQTTSQTDPQGVMTLFNTLSGTLTIFPKCFTNSPSNYFYFNGGVNSPYNASYAPVSNPTYCPNGRPFWVSDFVNEGNIVVCMPVTTENDGTTAKLLFTFPPINWNSVTTMNYYMTLELINLGTLPSLSDVNTSNWDTNI
jgi:hypothetical protein